MCSINDRNKLNVYEYFIGKGEAGVNYADAVRALKAMNVRFTATGYGIEPFLIAMRDSGKLEKLTDTWDGGVYRITDEGVREYEGRKKYAGVA